ncbi:MAG TPA: hypothetical protein ENI97_06090 [Gammaproteobacteria bacterium]|nr:hypothetical protein [Gammaproteobacteria bacterium]
MQTLLDNPAFQAAGAPFVSTLLLALVLRRFWPAGMGLAITAGFLLAAALIAGLNLQPLTSTRKIILSSVVLPLLVLVMGFFPRMRGADLWRWLPTVLLTAAAMWILWPVLQRQEGGAVILAATPVLLYTVVLSAGFVALASRQAPVDQAFNSVAAALLTLGLASGAVSLIAASALYSQLAFAVAASCGAMIVVGMLGSKGHWDACALHAASMPVILLAGAATVYAQLPELVLLCLALVPLFVVLPLPRPSRPWPQLIVMCLWSAVPVLPALWLAWRAAGPVSF